MARKRRTTLQRAELFKLRGGRCHLCGEKIGAREAWDLDHVIAYELTCDDSDANLAPAHKLCHARKTVQADQPAILRAKRREALDLGAKAPPERPICSRGFPDRKAKHPATSRVDKLTLGVDRIRLGRAEACRSGPRS